MTPATGMKGPKSGWTFRNPFRFPSISLGTIRAPPSIKGVKPVSTDENIYGSFSEFPGRIGPAFDMNEITTDWHFLKLARQVGNVLNVNPVTLYPDKEPEEHVDDTVLA